MTIVVRSLTVALALVAGMLLWTPSGAQVGTADQVCGTPTQTIALVARRMPGGHIGYGLAGEKPTIPGPTIEMYEGECLAVDLVNDTNRPLGMHAHGVAYTTRSDGTPLNASCVRPGGSRTYLFRATLPGPQDDGSYDPGSAGYWHYHDHCMGTPHGTEGIASGLFGALIIRRAGDLLPDRPPNVVVMSGTTINLKRAPHTPIIQANQGQRIEFVVIGHGDLFHTFHLHGHRWADNRTGMATGPGDASQIIDIRNVGPAVSFGFQIIAGKEVGPGAWFYHCHVQEHSDLGMNGLFVVRTPEGELTPSTRAAIKRWKRHESHHGG